MNPALSRGAENIIDAGKFDPDRILRFVANERVTVLPFLAPTMIVRLLEADPAIRVPALRALIYGGAPIHLRHLRAARQRFGPMLTQLYGHGESPLTISVLPAWAHENTDDEALQSSGFVRAGLELRILDADGAIAPHGEVGEIAVRGDVVMRGYWRNDDANAASLRDGWLRTGDIGRFDAQGHLHILDRQQDVIIRGAPTSTRARSRTSSRAIRRSAKRSSSASPIRNGEKTSRLQSCCAKDAGVDADTLIAFCRDHLGSFKKPKRIEFVTELPKNAYGKVFAPGFARSVQLSTMKRQIFVEGVQKVVTVTLRSAAKACGVV